MLFNRSAAIVAVLATAVSAQGTSTRTTATSPTTSSPAATGTTVADIVRQLPTCALNCLKSNAPNIGCDAANFACMCNKQSEFLGAVGPCVVVSCEGDEVTDLTTLAPQLCAAVQNNPEQADVASASSYVASLVGATGSSSSSSGFAAQMTQAPGAMVMFGGAAAAAAAGWAL